MSFLRTTGAIAMKDLRVEFRSREIVYTMVFFAAVVALIASFAFVEKVPSVGDLAAGILWIAVAFSASLGLSRAFDREREWNTMRALLLSPAARASIFLGKAVGITVFVLLTGAVVLPMTAVLFNAPIDQYPHLAAALLVLGAGAFAVVGSTFAAMLLRSRAREVLLPVILFPIMIPALMAGTKGTAAIWSETPSPDQALYSIVFLVVFDAVFLCVSLWAFESLVVE